MLHKFRPEMFDAEHVTDKDVEDRMIEDHYDTMNGKTAADMVHDGCYKDGDEDREPRLQGMMRVINQREDGVVIHRAPALEVVGGLAAHPDPIDLVDEGEIYLSEKGQADYQSKRPYHDRVSGWMFKVKYKARSRKASPTGTVCQHCGEEFHARKGTKYCSANCRKRAHEDSKIVSP
jgi:hypothetical protein